MELNVSFLMIEFLVVALAGVVMLLDLFWLKGKGVRLGWIAAAGMGVEMLAAPVSGAGGNLLLVPVWENPNHEGNSYLGGFITINVPS